MSFLPLPVNREDVDWLRQETSSNDERVKVSKLAQDWVQLRMEYSKRSERRIEAVAQMEADSDHRDRVPCDVDRILEDFEHEPVQVAHFNAIDHCRVVSAVLERDQVQDDEHENKRSVESHELRLEARFLLAVRRHRVFLWSRLLVFERQPEAVDDVKKKRDHKTRLRDIKKRVRDERVAVLVVCVTVKNDEQVCSHVRKHEETPDEARQTHDLFAADS